MLRIVLLCALAWVVNHPVWAGTVQCKCPKVEAKGTGDTSCSATETGSKCTIDFNTFNPADEQRATEFLSDATFGGIKFVDLQNVSGSRALTPEAAFQLADSDAEGLVDLLLIYLLVSAVQTEGLKDIRGMDDLHRSMRMRALEVSQAFAGRSGDASFSDGALAAVVRHGCFVVTSASAEYWGMYKANWSEFASQPQCGN